MGIKHYRTCQQCNTTFFNYKPAKFCSMDCSKKYMQSTTYKEEQSKRMTEWYENLTPEQEKERIDKITKTNQENADWFSINTTLNRAIESDEEKKTREDNFKESIKDSEAWAKRGAKISKTFRSLDWPEIARDTYSRRSEESRRLSKTFNRQYLLVDGSLVFRDSSWEADLSNLLIKFSITHEYHKKITFADGSNWETDFFIPERNLIIEIKGAPVAWKNWHEKQLPAILRNNFDTDTIKICDFRIRDRKEYKSSLDNYTHYETFDSFLMDLIPVDIKKGS